MCVCACVCVRVYVCVCIFLRAHIACALGKNTYNTYIFLIIYTYREIETGAWRGKGYIQAIIIMAHNPCIYKLIVC